MTFPLSLANPSSALLARQWAQTFDALRVRYLAPAPRVRLGDDIRFRATFFLPAARQRVIVLPSHDDVALAIQRQAIDALPRRFELDECPDLPIILALPAGALRAWDRDALHRGPALSPAVHCCAECGQWFFCDDSQSWVCQVSKLAAIPAATPPRSSTMSNVVWGVLGAGGGYLLGRR